ncbi:conserved hypothetical protein [Histoplasma capsulatum H143]|nr:conserved hypothetical protein [Histoplasma capsulatum H143]
MSPSTTLVDLPDDILFHIFLYLEPGEFLSLCGVNRHMQSNFKEASEYWRVHTLRTFRIPIRRLFHPNGPRWYSLYKTLSAKCRIFTWGRVDWLNPVDKPWPAEIRVPGGIGNVADLQCSQFSIAILTSDGIIYLEGFLYNDFFETRDFKPLRFPSRFRPTSKHLYEPATAISQMSCGRNHILGFSDDGRIWSWHAESAPCCQMRFSNVDISLGSQDRSRSGTVTKVVAGWAYNSAYITGTGILYWKARESVSNMAPDDDGVVAISASIIPRTEFRRLHSLPEAEHPMGEVRNYVVLDKYIVFITDANKAFATQLRTGDTTELPKFSAPGRIFVDIQGTYQNFAIFTAGGEVLLGNILEIRRISPTSSNSKNHGLEIEPAAPPSLQHSDVISIAFGDCHFHALHANGKISAHGIELQPYGSLGLGSSPYGVPFRGLKHRTSKPSGDLVKYPFAENSRSPQFVWFEPEKKLWLSYLKQECQGNEERSSIWAKALTLNRRGILEEYCKCIERQGEAWGDFPDIKELDSDDALGAYFAVSIAAGGRQSAALVLVNDDLAKKIKDKHVLEYNSGIEPVFDPRPERLPDDKQPIKYRFELGNFPTPHLTDRGDIDTDRYDFSTWKYGFPGDNSQVPN